MGNKETDVAHFGFPDEMPDIDVYGQVGFSSVNMRSQTESLPDLLTLEAMRMRCTGIGC